MTYATRPARAGRLAALTLILSLLAACSTGRDVPDGYGQTTQTNFTEGCTTTLTASDDVPGSPMDADEARSVCGCAYDSISDPDTGIPFDEFKAIDEQLSKTPAPLPPPISERVEACADDLDSEPT